MRVYVVGSLPKEASAEDRASFQQSCSALGEHFAAVGHEFVLGSIAEHTADFSIIHGIKKFLTKNPAKTVMIHLIIRDYVSIGSPNGQVGINSVLPQQNFAVKKIFVRAGGNHARLVAGLSRSDAVLLIAGASGTFTTGVAAVAMRHPTLALPQFGGAAEQTWQILLPHYARRCFGQGDIERISGSWDDDSPKTIASALQKLRTHNPFVERVDKSQILLSAAALLATILWLMVFAKPKQFLPSFLVAFFVLSGISTALGSLSRSIVKCYFEASSVFSLGRFLSESVLGVVVAFLIYLLLQLGGVVVSGETMSVQMNDEQQFSRMSLVMSLVGFAASYLIETSLERVRIRLADLLDEATKST